MRGLATESGEGDEVMLSLFDSGSPLFVETKELYPLEKILAGGVSLRTLKIWGIGEETPGLPFQRHMGCFEDLKGTIMDHYQE